MNDNTTTPAPWVELAGRALAHAAAHRSAIAVRCVERIVREHGPDVLPNVLLAWVDTAWGRLYPNGLPDGFLDRPMRFWREGSGDTATVDDVPPSVRWAGRFIFARLADDQVQAEALIASVRTDEEWSGAVMAVLDVAGSTLRLAVAQAAAGGVR